MRRQLMTGLFLLLSMIASANDQDKHSPEKKGLDDYEQQRQHMMREIRRDFIETASHTNGLRLSKSVAEALNSTPRHRFVPAHLREIAYANRPLNIGHRQTISQPFIVALMTEGLQLQGCENILEIGTGSGYQAAVLSPLCKQVYTIEIVPELAASARERLQPWNNIEVVTGNGYLGLPEHAPFDRIIVTAGGDIPPALLEQLAPGGKMIIPVGPVSQIQFLTVIDKSSDGKITQDSILPVRFVPLRQR